MSVMRPHILIVGGGYVGLYAALRLQQRLRPGEARITVVDPGSYMTYQPFLPEAAAGSIEPRHVVVPLRKVLKSCHVLAGRITTLNHAARVARFAPNEGEEADIEYDVLVMAPGSIARTLPIPGLKENGIGFKNVAEAIYLRNHVISRLEIAESTTDEVLRRRALTFLCIGGGYAGIEALAELEDMSRAASRYYRTVEPTDMRWVLVEASNRILPEVSLDMAEYTLHQLRGRGIEVHLNTLVESLEGGRAVLNDGTQFDTETVIWTAGVKPNPLLRSTDLPVDEKGRLRATEYLTVAGVEGAWTAGDCAAVPDLAGEPGSYTGPTAQHAVRQAKRLADNLIAVRRGEPMKPYKHAYVGSVASLGLHRGVAQVYGIKVRGWPAWFLHRTYHMTRMPTFNRKVRIVADWTLALFFEREIVSLGQFANPREEFEQAAASLTPVRKQA